MLAEKITAPSLEEQARLASFNIERQHQDAFRKISEILRPHATELATAYLDSFLKAAGIEIDGAARAVQIAKIAEYSTQKYTPPIDADWIARVEKRGRHQFKLRAPTYANLGAMSRSHRLSAEIIFNEAGDLEEGRYLVEQFMRVSALEAEIMVSTVQRLEDQAFKQTMMAHADAFEASITGIVQSSKEQSSAATKKSGLVSDAAEELLHLSNEVAAGSEQATNAMSEAAKMAGGLNSAIDKIDHDLRSVFDSFDELTDSADQAKASAEKLNDHGKSIEQVVKLIRAIADQISILSLNALIEAASAGDAGKGFTVVAGEMRALASQTGKATQDIVSQLGGIGQASKDSIASHNMMAGRFSALRAFAQDLRQSLGRQAVNVAAIATCIDETAQSAARSAETTLEISRRAAGVTDNISEVEAGMADLDGKLEALRTSADLFLEKISR